MRFEGVFVAHATPFTRDGALDEKALRRHLEFLADQGVHGFVPCGTTGESPTLSASERATVIRVAVEVAKARGLKVIAGTGSNSTELSVKNTREARELGCDGALVVTPYYNKSTPRGILAHFTTVAEQGGLPVVLYNVPGRTSVSLSASQIGELFAHPGIVGIKEASGSHGQWMDLAHRMDLGSKALLAGDDDCFATVLALGGCGIISASANVAPGLFVRIFEAFAQGDWKRGFDLQKRFLPLGRALFRETNPGPVKYALHRLGWAENVLRLPLVPVEEATAREIDGALASLKGEL